MHLLPLWVKGENEPTWKIYSIASEDETCPITEALHRIIREGDSVRHVEAMVALIKTISFDTHGPQVYIGTTVCHEAVSGEAIYAFRKGSLRLYWFYGADRKVVICPHIDTKHVPKTSKALAKKLTEIKDSYFDAAKEGCVTYGAHE